MGLRKIKKKFKRIKKPKVYDRTTVGTSKLESIFHTFLLSIGIQVETQFQIDWKFYDFKVKDKNILIEMDGDYFHANPEVIKKPLNTMQKKAIINDKKKDFLAKQNGYTLIRIWENDFKKNKLEVKQRLLSII